MEFTERGVGACEGAHQKREHRGGVLQNALTIGQKKAPTTWRKTWGPGACQSSKAGMKLSLRSGDTRGLAESKEARSPPSHQKMSVWSHEQIGHVSIAIEFES